MKKFILLLALITFTASIYAQIQPLKKIKSVKLAVDIVDVKLNSFQKAFSTARKDKKTIFTWNGKEYNTRLRNDTKIEILAPTNSKVSVKLNSFQKAFSTARKDKKATFIWNEREYNTQFKIETRNEVTKLDKKQETEKPARKPAEKKEEINNHPIFKIDTQSIWNLLKYDPNDPLIFSTSLFLFLFFCFLIFYNLLGKNKAARIFLLITFSLYFYYKAAGMYFLILVVSAVANFFVGKWIAKTDSFPIKRLFLVLALILNVALLGYFKYTNFILQIIADISKNNIDSLAIFLPIGISFYTFKSLTYVFDIYYDTLKPTNSLRDFCLYVFFFPNILLGPIDRAADFLPQIDREPFISKEDIGRALFLIMLGLIKKVVIADYISLNFVDRIFDFPLRFTGVENLLAIYAYVLQIYCDFSGYSDMAIGVALLLGFKLMDNFNYPFKATSIADFWRRWHISLSKWLLDYLFKPIQISSRSMKIFGNVLALIVTFFVCGLWHGAGWNFILWGVFHGVLMSISLFFKKPKEKLYKLLRIHNTRFLRFFQIVITFHLVALSFLIFRANDFQSVIDMLDQIYQFFHAEVFFQFAEKLPLIFGLLLLGYLFHFLPVKLGVWIQKYFTVMPLLVKVLIFVAIIWLAAQFKSADIQPFIYFQF